MFTTSKMLPRIADNALRFNEDTNDYTHLSTGQRLHRVTTPLQIIAKGYGFNNWLKTQGFAADEILKKSQEDGTAVHGVCEAFQLSKDKSRKYFDSLVKAANLSPEAVQKCTGFWNCFKEIKPEILGVELKIYHTGVWVEDTEYDEDSGDFVTTRYFDKGGYAGTMDAVWKVGDEIWLLDLKTGKSLHKEMRLQLAAYTRAFNLLYDNEKYKTAITHRKILHLKDTKTGYNLKAVDTDVSKDYGMYQTVRSLAEYMRGGFLDG